MVNTKKDVKPESVTPKNPANYKKAVSLGKEMIKKPDVTKERRT